MGPDGDSTGRDRRLGRRAFVKGIGATAAAGVGTKYVGSPVGDADAAVVTSSILIAAGAGVAVGAVGGVAFGSAIGGPDASEVSDAIGWQAHVDEFTRAREDQLQLDQTLASLERDVQLVENKAREEAIFRIYEQAVDSGTEADATAAAEEAINDAYATVEKGIYQSWNIRANRMNAIIQAFLDTNGGSNTGDIPAIRGLNMDDSDQTQARVWSGDHGGFSDKTLLDGEQFQLYQATTSDDLTVSSPDPDVWGGGPGSSTTIGAILLKPDSSDYDTVDEPLDIDQERVNLLDPRQWAPLMSDLYDAHSSMVGEVSSMVDSYYQPAKDGEIDMYEAIGPKHLTDTASTAKDYQEAAMALRGMGYPMSEQVATISLPTDSGDPLELTGRLSWTAHQGNTLAVGQTHFAENIPGSIYAAVNLPDGVDSVSDDTNTTNTTDDGSTSTGPGAEIIELTDEFTIVSAEGADGVSFKDRSLATSDSTTEEINQIFKENYTANKEATENVHDTATGGGGGWSGLSTAEKAGAAVVAVLAAAGILGNN